MMEIIGRRTSLFTRVPLLFAHALDVPCTLTSIADMTEMDPEVYAGNPALKLPILRTDTDVIFGAQNICRVVAEHAAAVRAVKIAWPENLSDVLSRNAQELAWHAMSAQVQLVMGTTFAGLPADNVYFVKARVGLQASLAWLDEHVEAVVARLPGDRDLSLFEVAVFCLVEHLTFRPSVPMGGYADLRAFADAYGALPAAGATGYK